MTITPTVLGTRAVVRILQAGGDNYCVYCELQLKWHARKKQRVVICNIYKGIKWDRIEWFHRACYDRAEHPHGAPLLGDQWPPTREGFVFGKNDPRT